jgi:glutaminyl-tRNA synthetase
MVPFSKILYIEQEDFREDPPKQFYRLAPGREVRLRYGYLITCREAIKDAEGRIVELRCTYDPETRGGTPRMGGRSSRRSTGSRQPTPIDAEVRLYDTLFTKEDPNEVEEGQDFHCQSQSGFAEGADRAARSSRGCVMPFPERATSSSEWAISALTATRRPGRPVFNRTIALKDTWAKIEQKSRKTGVVAVESISGRCQAISQDRPEERNRVSG